MKKNLIAKLLVSIMLFSWCSSDTTGAYFTTKESSDNNAFTTGWWQKPEVKVITPKKGDIFYLKDTMNITWSVVLADPSSTFSADVYISLDNGDNYKKIGTNLPNSTSLKWKIPDKVSYFTDEGLIKVTIKDSHNLKGHDISGKFTITAKEEDMISVDVTHPKSGMQHKLGQKVLIKWTTDLLDPKVDFDSDLYISVDNGTTFEKIANDLRNEKQYHWDIPKDKKYITSQAIVKVVVEDEFDNEASDRSGVFEIKDKDKDKEKESKDVLELPEVKESTDEIK